MKTPKAKPDADIRITVPFPPGLYKTVCDLAKTEVRSFGKQVVFLVKKALEDDRK